MQTSLSHFGHWVPDTRSRLPGPWNRVGLLTVRGCHQPDHRVGPTGLTFQQTAQNRIKQIPEPPPQVKLLQMQLLGLSRLQLKSTSSKNLEDAIPKPEPQLGAPGGTHGTTHMKESMGQWDKMSVICFKVVQSKKQRNSNVRRKGNYWRKHTR